MNQRKKIVVTQDLGLFPDQVEQLEKLGQVTLHKELPTPEQWLERTQGADVICTGKRGLVEKVYELENVFISLPFVGAGFLDKEKLRQRNITVARSPGCNRDSVAEWIIGMTINLLRRLPRSINTQSAGADLWERQPGLTGKAVCILGRGNVGSKVGRICGAMDMNVDYFVRGDDLQEKTRGADILIDCLSLNPTTEHLLGAAFYQNLKRGAYFITPTSEKIWDPDAMLRALDNGILAGVATDLGGGYSGNIADPLYQRLSAHPKILATPHISWNSDVAERKCNDAMIANVEAWLRAEPQNIV